MASFFSRIVNIVSTWNYKLIISYKVFFIWTWILKFDNSVLYQDLKKKQSARLYYPKKLEILTQKKYCNNAGLLHPPTNKQRVFLEGGGYIGITLSVCQQPCPVHIFLMEEHLNLTGRKSAYLVTRGRSIPFLWRNIESSYFI